jgi:hypothetical protein
MGLLSSVLAAWLSLSATEQAGDAAHTQSVVNARNSVVESALSVRRARLDCERAEALLDEAEAGVQAAHIEREKEEEMGNAREATGAQLVAAHARSGQAFSTLQAQAARLGHAETRLRQAEDVLERAEASSVRP